MKKILQSIKDYYDPLIVLIAIFMLIVISFLDLSFFDFDMEQAGVILQEATIIILGLLAIGIIRDRKARQDLLKTVNVFAMDYKTLEIRERFFGQFRDVIRAGNSEILCQFRSGISLKHLMEDLCEALENGNHVKIILCDQSDEIGLAISHSNRRLSSIEEVRREQESAREAIAELECISNGTLEVREIRYHPSTLKCIVDPKIPNGLALIIPVTFLGDARKAPSIKLHRRHNHDEFEYYYSEFMRYWEFAKRNRIT